MYYFHNDYNEICHPSILQYLQEISACPMEGYGEDVCCRHAAELIRRACANNTLAVHFLSGGTQTNLTVIASALRPHQAVLAAESGHIYVHETGAIEAAGHKVIPLPSDDGKITAYQVESAVQEHWSDVNHEHMPQPKLVYISQPSEFGTLYTLDELATISAVCKRRGLYLFIDGARLGYALMAEGNNIGLPEIAELADAFYIGGTKQGAMFGEAVVISNPRLQEDFRYIIKQRGGMLAKGWLLGAQFEKLFEDNKYWALAKHANHMADKLREALLKNGYPIAFEGRTNQVFTVLPVSLCGELSNQFTFAPWQMVDETHKMVRFCTSWATTPESIEALCGALKKQKKLKGDQQ